MSSVLDVRVLRGHEVGEVADTIARLLGAPVTADRYGNPAIVLQGQGTIAVAPDGWDEGAVLAEVRATDPSLADRAYTLLEANTDWPVELVDSTDLHPEDVIIRHRDQVDQIEPPKPRPGPALDRPPATSRFCGATPESGG